ncbi:hypothetical protein NFI96_007744 [Prochilodus magdalenae]|nr:hypothetical protein NFI96_007744 [Prochilodus magdalenae]
MERSQSRISLSASFEALAIYFPCMNSFDEDDADRYAVKISLSFSDGEQDEFFQAAKYRLQKLLDFGISLQR